MDISFVTDEGKFNYRACAIIISDGRIKKNELNVYTVAESYCLDSPIMFEGWKNILRCIM